MKYAKDFIEYFSPFPVFTARDARLFFMKRKAGAGYYRLFMHNMVKRGRVLPIVRGSYTLNDDPFVAGFAFSPFYYGLETVLAHYKLWDYPTPITIVTTNRVRKSGIVLLGRNAGLKKIQKRYFFRYSMIPYGDNFYIPMADMEKTIIDSVYFNSPFSEAVYAAMAERVDKSKLLHYLNRYSGAIKRRVLNVCPSIL